MAKILIVDDDPNLRMLYELELQRMGYDTTACESAAACMQYLARETPDLVILDILLPGRDGLEILQSIRSSHSPLPVILNTSYANYRDNFLTYAADRCLIKSSDTSELLATIERLLNERKPTWNTAKKTDQSPSVGFSRAAYFSGPP
jgi:DNA-binding response OmpR family regulator